MDSSSESDEFYECDDDLEVEDKQQKKEINVKENLPDVNQPKQKNVKPPSKIIKESSQNVLKEEHKKDNIASEESNSNPEVCKPTQQRPEFGVPPARVTCWFPGVIPETQLPESEVHPAYIKHLEKQRKTSEEVEETKCKDIKSESEVTNSNSNCEISSNLIQIDKQDNNKKESVETKCDTSCDKKEIAENISEVNQWDNDNWDDDTEIKSTEVSKTTESKLESITQIKQSETTKQDNTDKTEENLWDDEEDWGKLESTEVKASMITTDDLWGEGDGWSIDTPEEIPTKPKTQPIPKPQTHSSNSNDLWAEGDNWGIDNKQEQSQSNQNSTFETLANQETSPTWSGWSNWSISSVLSTAANITTSVSQGLTTVLESGMGVPDPEDLARLHLEEEKLNKDEQDVNEEETEISSEKQSEDKTQLPFNLGIGNWVSGVSSITKLVETTGSKVITSGLGTLETIGKKTYEVLQENDPQLKRKRAFLKKLEGDKPVLSQILREAKEKAENENKEREQRHFAKKANYETMFDDYQGLVHLEALEMLSKQCEIKLDTIMAEAKDLEELQETMDQIKDLCELNSEDDEEENGSFEELKEKINTAVEEINIGISCDKLLETFAEIVLEIESCKNGRNPSEVHSNAIENLAKVTALAVEQYHKSGELLLIKEHRSTADEADSLVQLTTAISALITILSIKYSEKLKELVLESSNVDIKSMVSNIFLEAANSSRYIEDAFSLLIPVIQVGAV